MGCARVQFLECPLDPWPKDMLLAEAERQFAAPRKPIVIEGLNVAKLVAARQDPELLQALHAADYVHVDGAGIRWGAALLGIPNLPRYAGIDFMMDLLQHCAQQGKRVFLLGAHSDVLGRAVDRVKVRYPHLKIAGSIHGYFTEEDAPAIAQSIAATKTDLLLVGISSPKKERFLLQHAQACGAAIAMGVGGAFDVLAGDIRRAPRWVQQIGAEWIFRLLQEPRRLGMRYLTSNSIYGWLLVNAHWNRQTKTTLRPWKPFLASLPPGAATYRHELYFLQQKRWGGRLHALAALLRDGWLLLSVPKKSTLPEVATTLAVVTLRGPSGEGALKRMATGVPPATWRTIAHPRTGLDVYRLPRVSLREATTLFFRHCRNPVSGKQTTWVMRCCALRHHLWVAAWKRLQSMNPQIRQIWLHNDFDMMSRSCLTAWKAKADITCVQHGIPTDEFFPVNAPRQLVWGESSAHLYRTHSPQAELLVDAMGRAAESVMATEIPQGVQLASQTHTPIYGIAMRPWFEALAISLQPLVPLTVLLHPQEKRTAVSYRVLTAKQVQSPPHDFTTCHLVVGYASTALLDAAQAGNYVAAMAWPVQASLDAWAISRPPLVCADAAAVMALYETLCTSAEARAEHAAAQMQWLQQTFIDSGEWKRYVAT